MNQPRIAGKGNVEIIFGTGDHAFIGQTRESFIKNLNEICRNREVQRKGRYHVSQYWR